jgi:hypothetical protein
VTAERHRLVALALAASAWLLGLELLGVEEAVAYLAPTLVLLVPLLLGRYPGERAMAAALGRGPSRAKRRPATMHRPRTRFRSRVPRGGALLAARLAGRAPPSGIRP